VTVVCSGMKAQPFQVAVNTSPQDGQAWLLVSLPGIHAPSNLLPQPGQSSGECSVILIPGRSSPLLASRRDRRGSGYSNRLAYHPVSGFRCGADPLACMISRLVIGGLAANHRAPTSAYADRTDYHWIALGITVPHFLSLNSTVNLSVSEHENPGHLPAGVVWAFTEGTTRLITAPGRPPGSRAPVASPVTGIGCWPAVQRVRPPRQRPEAFLPEKVSIRLRRAPVTVGPAARRRNARPSAMSRPVQGDGGEPAGGRFAKWSWTPGPPGVQLKVADSV
jgi:hypothetical protein